MLQYRGPILFPQDRHASCVPAGFLPGGGIPAGLRGPQFATDEMPLQGCFEIAARPDWELPHDYKNS